MTVTLSEKAAAFVEAQIQTGAFKSASEVIDYMIALKRGRELLESYPASEMEAWLLAAADSPRTQWRGHEEIEEILAEVQRHAAVK